MGSLGSDAGSPPEFTPAGKKSQSKPDRGFVGAKVALAEEGVGIGKQVEAVASTDGDRLLVERGGEGKLNKKLIFKKQ